MGKSCSRSQFISTYIVLNNTRLALTTNRATLLYSSKDIEAIRHEAEDGDIDAMFDYALLHEEGVHVKKNWDLSALWYQRAAENGDVEAQFRLGHLLHLGVHDQPDDEKAVYWFLRAAMQGHAEAQCAVAIAYYNGEGLDVDLERAFYWHNEAAHQGETTSQACLGDMLIHGEGVRRARPMQGLKWLNKAAGQDDDLALYLLGSCYLYGQVVEQDEEKAREFLQRSANYGNIEAKYLLGVMLLDEERPCHDTKKALRYIRNAASEDYPPALYTLGTIYADGYEHISPKAATAFRYFMQAAQADHSAAQFRLYTCYLQGFGVEANEDTATDWLFRSAEGGCPEAQYHLGCLLFGTAASEDELNVALNLFSASAQQGETFAIEFLKFLRPYRRTLKKHIVKTILLFNKFCAGKAFRRLMEAPGFSTKDFR